jgi:hypothetical protein
MKHLTVTLSKHCIYQDKFEFFEAWKKQLNQQGERILRVPADPVEPANASSSQ